MLGCAGQVKKFVRCVNVTNGMATTVTFSELRAAQEYLDKKKVLLPTKLIRSIELEKQIQRNLQIYLKPENLQRTGSYKVRGAFNKMRSLQGEEIQRGVITASSGNHAQGVAYAAKALEIQCRIVMPTTAPKAKKMATTDYGVEVLERGESYDEAYEAAKKMADESKETFVEAFDDLAVIAGHGTVGLESRGATARARRRRDGTSSRRWRCPCCRYQSRHGKATSKRTSHRPAV